MISNTSDMLANTVIFYLKEENLVSALKCFIELANLEMYWLIRDGFYFLGGGGTKGHEFLVEAT